MRIVLISDWFAEAMGYSENCLPKVLAALGHQVHVITSDAQPYFNSPGYAETYEPFIGPGVVATGVKALDGYVLHRLPHAWLAGRLRIRGLQKTLTGLRPDVVQAFETLALTTLEASWIQPRVGFKLFLESHVHASVFDVESQRRRWRPRLKWWFYRRTAGAWLSSHVERCYPISTDAAELAVEFFGITPQKIEVCSLGVDTDAFRPPLTVEERQARADFRTRLGFGRDDIVCIYTGRFALDKGPQLLAQAIDQLARRGERYRGLFVGSGTSAEVTALRDKAGCQVHPFVPARELPLFYWAADVGVWPRQESTSQLDAAACGLPIVLSDRVAVLERVEGNGLMYAEGNVASLVESLVRLKPIEERQRLGQAGSEKMRDRFSWRRIAEARTSDYAAALKR